MALAAHPRSQPWLQRLFEGKSSHPFLVRRDGQSPVHQGLHGRVSSCSELWTRAITSAAIWLGEPGVVQSEKALMTTCFPSLGSDNQGKWELNGGNGRSQDHQEGIFYH